MVQFIALLSASTVSNQSVRLSRSGGVVSSTVTYDAVLNQITLTPRQRLLANTTCTMTVGSRVADLMGNHLPSEYVSTFSTEPIRVFLPIVMRNWP